MLGVPAGECVYKEWEQEVRAAPTPGSLRHFELRPFLRPGPCRAKSPKKATSEGAGGPGFGEVAQIVGPDDACTQDQGEDQTLAEGSQALATEDQKSVATKKSKKEVETEEDAKKQLRRLLESNMKTTGEAELLQMNAPEGLGLAVSEVLRQNLIAGQGSRGGASARVGQREPRRPPAPLSGIPPVCAPTVPTLPQTRTETSGSGRGDTAAHVAVHAHLYGRTHAPYGFFSSRVLEISGAISTLAQMKDALFQKLIADVGGGPQERRDAIASFEDTLQSSKKRIARAQKVINAAKE